MVWARADRPARMLVEVATTESFRHIRHAGLCRRAAGERLHRQAAARRPAGGAGHLLPRPVPESVVAGDHRRAAGRALPHRAGRSQGGVVHLVGRHRRRRLGHRCSRAAACAPTRPCCANRPDFFIHSGDIIYADVPDRGASTSCRTARCGERRHRGEIEGRRDARRVPRQLQIQSARREPARVQRRGADLRAMGRPRGHQRLDSRRQHPHGGGYREKSLLNLVARGSRAFHEFLPLRQHAGRGRPHLPQDLLRSAARRVHARHALVSRRQRATRSRATVRTPICSVRRNWRGSSASCCARARPGR